MPLSVLEVNGPYRSAYELRFVEIDGGLPCICFCYTETHQPVARIDEAELRRAIKGER